MSTDNSKLHQAWLKSSVKEFLDDVSERQHLRDDETFNTFADSVYALWMENQRLTQGDELRVLLRNNIRQFGAKRSEIDLRLKMEMEFENAETKDRFWIILYDLTSIMDDIEDSD